MVAMIMLAMGCLAFLFVAYLFTVIIEFRQDREFKRNFDEKMFEAFKDLEFRDDGIYVKTEQQ